MKAFRVHRFGSPEVMELDDVPKPTPAADQVLVRIKAAGVGPWDAWIRAGHSALPQPLPLTLGSDIAGIVESVGSDVRTLAVGDEIYGVTNERFTDGYAEYAVAKAAMVALKPNRLSFIEAASVPVIAVTAWQMLFDQAATQPGQRVLILGAAGSVGAMAVQIAHLNKIHVVAVMTSNDEQNLRDLGANEVVRIQRDDPTWETQPVDVVVDAVGGNTQQRAISFLKPGGFLISAVSAPDPTLLQQRQARGGFFLVNVTTAMLNKVSELIDANTLSTNVGTVLPFESARIAHEMLDGSRPHPRGKIVLNLEAN